MSAKKQFLAVFVGSDGARRKAWHAMSEAQQKAKTHEGIKAWGAWAERHQASIVQVGGPLGKTKRVGPHGIADASNSLAAYTIVQAESHEAAAKLFENHPHFSLFPGDGVEIMPVLPIPGM